MRNCEGVSHGRTNKNDRYSFLKRIQMWQCLRHFDAGMDMARYSAAVVADRCQNRSKRFLNLGRAGRE